MKSISSRQDRQTETIILDGQEAIYPRVYTIQQQQKIE